jgi:hypothetical protein
MRQSRLVKAQPMNKRLNLMMLPESCHYDEQIRCRDLRNASIESIRSRLKISKVSTPKASVKFDDGIQLVVGINDSACDGTPREYARAWTSTGSEAAVDRGYFKDVYIHAT